ncbi:MAG: DUF4920 domain-containing protein [Cytophagales bacterium]|nr:MAG: DUF4920 domain-containing protein [Cytophagales bacterium]
MKYTLIFALVLGLAAGASAQSSHGKKITEDGAVPAPELVAKLGDKSEMSTKIVGTVESVCKVKGCWMKVKTADGQTMRVTFKDYGFFVPKDIAGKQVVFEGVAKQTTTPVSELKHYAEDAGKSKAEIAKITEPEKAVTFVADGVIVK